MNQLSSSNLIRWKVLLSALFILIALISRAQPDKVCFLSDDSWQVPDKVIDIQHLDARITIDPYDTLVSGRADFTFSIMPSRVDSIVFRTPDMLFKQVILMGKPVLYRLNNGKLCIYPEGLLKDQLYHLVMEYEARPKYDLFLIGWKEPALRENKQIWAHRPFHWLPYYDDRLTVDLYITFDADYMVYSNGIRESVLKNSDGTRTWHYSMQREHPFFSTALVIGKYAWHELKTSDGVPLELWYYPWQEEHFEPTYRFTERMFDFLSEELGYDYPYELYREVPVEDYLYGAMETTTSTIFGDYMLVDARAFDGRNYVNVNIHELTHQWFGNCLSHLRGRDVWLTESFATYYAKMFEKEVFGDDYYQQVRLKEWEEAIEASEKDGFPVGHSRGGRARWYPKGSLVLGMMRDVIGDDDFRASIQYYIEHHAFSEVETNDLLASIRQATGHGMEWFFDEWIFRGGEPEYTVSYERLKEEDGTPFTVVYVKQTHKRSDVISLFKMPIVFEVHYQDGSFDRIKEWIEQESSHVEIPNPYGKAIDYVLFDPGRKILKKTVFNRSLEELKSQALRAPEMIDRHDALVALRDFPVADKEDVLLEMAVKEKYHLNRGEAIRQLVNEYLPAYGEIITRAVHDSDVYVRRAVLESMKTVPGDLKQDYESLLEDISYINTALALENLCNSFPADIDNYLEETADETGWRGRNIRMKWLEIAILSGKTEYLQELVEYSSPHYEFETRMNAFNVLRKINYLNGEVAENLFSGYLYWNYKVSQKAAEVLKYFYQQDAGRRVIDETLRNSTVISRDEKDRLEKLLG